MLITLDEYAEKTNQSRGSIYYKYRLKLFETAKKFGRVILVDDQEPLPPSQRVRRR